MSPCCSGYRRDETLNQGDSAFAEPKKNKSINIGKGNGTLPLLMSEIGFKRKLFIITKEGNKRNKGK